MEIPCSFQQVSRWYDMFQDDSLEGTKSGYYDSSNLHIEGLNSSVWAIVANIVLDSPIETYMEQGYTGQQIAEACVSYLNKPPTKRARKPKYGKLTLRYYNLLSDGRISASLLTTDRNNKYFWGKGSRKVTHRSSRDTKPSRGKRKRV